MRIAERLKAADVILPRPARRIYGLTIYIGDPDGTMIELYEEGGRMGVRRHFIFFCVTAIGETHNRRRMGFLPFLRPRPPRWMTATRGRQAASSTEARNNSGENASAWNAPGFFVHVS